MDSRHTEDFARRQEAAALRARYLRSQASAAFWRGVAQAAASLVRVLRQRARHALRRDACYPEA